MNGMTEKQFAEYLEQLIDRLKSIEELLEIADSNEVRTALRELRSNLEMKVGK